MRNLIVFVTLHACMLGLVLAGDVQTIRLDPLAAEALSGPCVQRCEELDREIGEFEQRLVALRAERVEVAAKVQSLAKSACKAAGVDPGPKPIRIVRHTLADAQAAEERALRARDRVAVLRGQAKPTAEAQAAAEAAEKAASQARASVGTVDLVVGE